MQKLEQYDFDLKQFLINVIKDFGLELDENNIPAKFNKKTMSEFISNLIELNSNNPDKTLECIDYMYKLGHCLSTFASFSISLDDLLQLNEIRKQYIKEIKNTANIINKSLLLDKYYNEFKTSLKERNNLLVNIVDSGVRASDIQLRQMLLARGYIETAPGKLVFIDDNYLDGLSLQSLVKSGEGARKATYDKAVSTFEPGYLTRQFIYNLSHIRFKEEDCHSNQYIIYKVTESNFYNLVGRYYYDIRTNKEKILTKDDKHLIGHNIPFRSVLHCKTDNGICRRCFGDWYYKDYDEIGIITAQTLGERGVQLTLRVFHTGSAVNIANTFSNLLTSYPDLLRMDRNIIILDKPADIKFDTKILTVKHILLHETKMIIKYNDKSIEIDLQPGYLLFIDKNVDNYQGPLFTINYHSIVNSIKLLKKILNSKFVIEDEKHLYKLIEVLFSMLSYKERIPLSMIELLIMAQLLTKDNNIYFFDRKFDFPMTKESIKIMPHRLGLGMLFERASQSFIYETKNINVESRIKQLAEE
jgi:hypothetical protein